MTRAWEWWDEPGWRRKLTPIRLRAVAINTDFRTAGELTAQALADETLEPAERRQVEVIHAAQLFHGGRVRQAHELIVRLRPSIPLRDEADELAMVMSSLAGTGSGLAIDRSRAVDESGSERGNPERRRSRGGHQRGHARWSLHVARQVCGRRPVAEGGSGPPGVPRPVLDGEVRSRTAGRSRLPDGRQGGRGGSDGAVPRGDDRGSGQCRARVRGSRRGVARVGAGRPVPCAAVAPRVRRGLQRASLRDADLPRGDACGRAAAPRGRAAGCVAGPVRRASGDRIRGRRAGASGAGRDRRHGLCRRRSRGSARRPTPPSAPRPPPRSSSMLAARTPRDGRPPAVASSTGAVREDPHPTCAGSTPMP